MEPHIIPGLIFLNTLLLGVVGYFIKRTLEKLDRLSEHRETCLREFATKDDAEELFHVARKHEGRIASMESWRATVERKT